MVKWLLAKNDNKKQKILLIFVVEDNYVIWAACLMSAVTRGGNYCHLPLYFGPHGQAMERGLRTVLSSTNFVTCWLAVLPQQPFEGPMIQSV